MTIMDWKTSAWRRKLALENLPHVDQLARQGQRQQETETNEQETETNELGFYD
jgi:hypothetical protein